LKTLLKNVEKLLKKKNVEKLQQTGLWPYWDSRSAKSFLRRAPIFQLCPKHFSKGGEQFSRGLSSCSPLRRACLYIKFLTKSAVLSKYCSGVSRRWSSAGIYSKIYDDPCEETRFNSILFDNNKHHYRNL